MVLYKLMVVHWSIFTLSIQLIYCASVYSNVDSLTNTAASSTSSSGESICSPDFGRYMHEKQVESSLTLNLHPDNTNSPCKSLLTAPESHGFLVRLHKPNIRKNHQSLTNNKNLDRSMKNMNITSSCPLNIISVADTSSPSWKIDPCMLESQTIYEEPVRLLPGRLKIIWNHGGNKPVYKLIITVMGKGDQCDENEKHPCLKFGQDVMLCVSKKLICDGIRHCPVGTEYDSDEDADMCYRHKQMLLESKIDSQNNSTTKPEPTSKISQFFEFIKNMKPSLDPMILTSSPDALDPTLSTKMENSPMPEITDKTEVRTSLTRGLSRYGPWGYLMLGMLLCGGALLICGLWECCCRSKKPVVPANNDNAANNSTTISSEHNNANINVSDLIAPPNYDEIDPPPSYATLFPNQKSISSNEIQLPNHLNDQATSTTASNSSNIVASNN